MSDEKQNGVAPDLKVGEDERFLFALCNTKTGEFKILFSDPANAGLLLRMAERWFDLNLLDPALRPQTAVSPVNIPGLDLGSLGRLRKKMGQS